MCDPTLDASQTARECSPYCSTMGRIFVVTTLCALLKLWSISRLDISILSSSVRSVVQACLAGSG